MAKSPPNTVPSSVILTTEQKAFIKKIAAKENRTFSHQLRHIITGWVAFHSQKKDLNRGEESEKESQEG